MSHRLNDRDRRAVGWGVALIGVGVLVMMLWRCQPGVGAWDQMEGIFTMGYANGKDCCHGECKIYQTLPERIDCCANRCPQWVDECVSSCIASMPRTEVYKELSGAARTLNNPLATMGIKTASRKLLDTVFAGPDKDYAFAAGKLLEYAGS